jgi:hypothetical protein
MSLPDPGLHPTTDPQPAVHPFRFPRSGYLEKAGFYADQLSDRAGELGTGIEIATDAEVEPSPEGCYVAAWIFVADEALEP